MSQSKTPSASIAISPTARLIIAACTMLGTVMQGLDSTIANVALPYMQGTMSASQEQINWVLTSYIVAAAIMTAPTGYLVARFGRTKFYVSIIAGFTLASVLCGMAQNLGQAVAFRIIQGMCGASLIPMSQVVMMDIYPVEKRGAAMGVWTMGVMLGPILGPTLGGFLTAHYSWRSVFYVNVPFGAIAALGLFFCLPEDGKRGSVKLDWLGFGALSLAIGMFQTVLDRGETLDWFSSKEIVIESILAATGLYIFIVQFVCAPKPFLSPRIFKDLNFLAGLVFIFLVGFSLYGTLALLAPYVQDLMNYSVSTAGLVLAPRGLGSMAAAVSAGFLLARFSARWVVAAGFLIAAYVQYRMTYWTPDVSAAAIVLMGLLQGVGITLVSVPISVVTFATLAPEFRTEATGLFSLFRTMGSAIGISVTGALLERNTQINQADISGAVTPFNRALQTGAALHFWNPAQLRGAAPLDSEIIRQGTIIAYSDDFRLMFLAMIITLPLVFLIRVPPRRNTRTIAAAPAKQTAEV